MKFVKYNVSYMFGHKNNIPVYVAALLVSFCSLSCQDQVYLPSPEQLADFEHAGPVGPAVDLEQIVRAKMSSGPYRVVPGEVIELTMPTILQIVTAEDPRVTASATPYICRVGEMGTITLPAVGEIAAAGKTLAEIEAAIVDAYYPAYAVTRPSVFAKILEYKTAKVSITGAVAKPGIYSLRSDQMSLVALLMEAGGIVEDGAATIRIIYSTGQHDREKAAEDYTSLQGVGLRLSFSQLTPSGTTGLLTVKRDGRVVLVDLLDVSSNVQRQTFLARLSMQEPEVSPAQVERELCLLAGQLEPGNDIGASENRVTLAKGTTGIEHRVGALSDGALEKLRDQLVEVLKHEEGLRQQGITKPQQGQNDRAIVLPVKGLNIPFADVALNEGDSVVVEPLRVPVFSVVGLVNKPGNFPYPPEVQYNLMQALAFAGGLDRDAEPRYAAIYRLKADGTIASASFQVVNVADGSRLTEALNVPIKANDIVAVEHTQRTRTIMFLQRMFSVHVGAYAPVWR